VAESRDAWIARNAFFYEEDYNFMRFLIPEGLTILELGCGTGNLLSKLSPSRGVGIDISPRMIEVATRNHQNLEFRVGDIEDPATFVGLDGPFNIIILSDTIGALEDCETTLTNLHALCRRDTRIIIVYYSHLWEPLLNLAERFGGKMPQPRQNWLSTQDISALLELADFEIIKQEWRQLLPKRLLGLGRLLNRFIAPLPLLRRLCLRSYVVARPATGILEPPPSATVIVPCRNEMGNIEAIAQRMPRFCDDLEIIFVEGHSSDGTYEEALRVKKAYPEYDIKVMRQTGIGKGNAVRLGFDRASGDVLMILDADMTVPPEDMPKFYFALVRGKGEFINGTRFVYPMEDEAMRFLNFWANRTFSLIFSYLLNQRFTDTLCGTKVLLNDAYKRIVTNRSYFGNFDPFGDFDLIFGAAKLNLKIIEIPIRYRARSYGSTQISRFTHGWLLLRMLLFAFRKLKAF
jgi:SAM-dependent methyltransferase